MPPHPTFSNDRDLETIGNGLLNRTLPKPCWTHAGHFAATLWIFTRRPDLQAARDMPAIIRAYNLATGVQNTDLAGYHETITQASIRAAQTFLAQHPNGTLSDRCNTLLSGPLGHPDWLLAYWSHARLFSAPARRAWVSPDLAELPF